MNSWANLKENHSDRVAQLQVFAKSHPFERSTSPLSSLTRTENAAAAVIMCIRENRNVSLKNLSPVLQKVALKPWRAENRWHEENAQPMISGFWHNFFASLRNILLIQSFHFKIASVFSLCQEIAMIGPISQLCTLIISRRNYACGKYAGSGLQKKQMCLWDDSSALHKAICRQPEAARKVWDSFTQPTRVTAHVHCQV